MKPQETYSLGPKPENPVREIHPFIRPNLPDVHALENDIQFYRDEVATLEREIKDLESELFDKEEEIEELKDEVDELNIRLETFESLEP